MMKICKFCGAIMRKASDFANNDISGDVCSRCAIQPPSKTDLHKEQEYLKKFLMENADFPEEQAEDVAKIYSTQREQFKTYLITERGFTEEQAEEFVKKWVSVRKRMLEYFKKRKRMRGKNRE